MTAVVQLGAGVMSTLTESDWWVGMASAASHTFYAAMVQVKKDLVESSLPTARSTCRRQLRCNSAIRLCYSKQLLPSINEKHDLCTIDPPPRRRSLSFSSCRNRRTRFRRIRDSSNSSSSSVIIPGIISTVTTTATTTASSPAAAAATLLLSTITTTATTTAETLLSTLSNATTTAATFLSAINTTDINEKNNNNNNTDAVAFHPTFTTADASASFCTLTTNTTATSPAVGRDKFVHITMSTPRSRLRDVGANSFLSQHGQQINHNHNHHNYNQNHDSQQQQQQGQHHNHNHLQQQQQQQQRPGGAGEDGVENHHHRSILWLPLIFALSTFFLYKLAQGFADGKELKFPTDMTELSELAKHLSHLKDKHWGRVLILFVAAYVYKQTFAIPGSVFLNVLSGALFGPWLGFALSAFLSGTGATCCYLLSQTFGQSYVIRWFPDKVALFRQKTEENRDSLLFFLLFVRMFPMSPNWLLNMAAPIVGIPIHLFFLSVFIGLMPYTFLCAQTGSVLSQVSSVGEIMSTGSMVSLGLAAVVALVPGLLIKRAHQRPAHTPS